MIASWPRIPYGEMSFRHIRVNGWLYVDKTRYLRPLEDERYVFFIRPRRFGKSCWLALLECYYGRHWAHEFEDLFGGTDVGREPTAERGRYVIVRFDFSAFDDTPETLEERFEGYCFIELRHALERHPDLFPELVRGMAYKGEWRSTVEYIAEAISEQTGIRDYIDGEKVIQVFLAAHFSVVGQFLVHSEREMNKGYADLHLGPFVAQYPDIAYGYVIEVKYLKRSERVDESVVAETMREAREQLAGYLARGGGVPHRCGTSGWRWCSTTGSWRPARRWSMKRTMQGEVGT